MQNTNDAPLPRKKANASVWPLPGTEEAKAGVTAADLAAAYYKDTDGEDQSMGIVVFSAKSSPSGRYQYSEDGGNIWADVSNV